MVERIIIIILGVSFIMGYDNGLCLMACSAPSNFSAALFYELKAARKNKSIFSCSHTSSSLIHDKSQA